MRRITVATLALLLVAVPAVGQILVTFTPTSSEETITVSTAAIGVTADLCESGNVGGAIVSVNTNGIYFSIHSSAATPDSGDFKADAVYVFYIKPANKLRMIRQSQDSAVKVQCVQ